MDDLIFFYPEGHQNHVELGHPERPERVEAICMAFQEQGWWQTYSQLDPIVIPDDVMKSIHQATYLEKLESVCRKGRHFDLDTYTTTASWELALNAAGGAAACAASVWKREVRRGFALTRPPGHHATPNRAMGFCLLNNVSLAAEYLIKHEGAKRLAIVDLDLHHGNGTQEIFYQRGEVFYLSTHQSPLYPGTGNIKETGIGEGKGTNANFPLPPFSGDQAFISVMKALILPLMERYNPEMILVSYGFDPHWRDPLGSLLLSAQGFYELISRLTNWADLHCDGKVAIFLEGGYDLEAAKACSNAVVAALLGIPWKDPLGPSPESEGKSWEIMFKRAVELWELKG